MGGLPGHNGLAVSACPPAVRDGKRSHSRAGLAAARLRPSRPSPRDTRSDRGVVRVGGGAWSRAPPNRTRGRHGAGRQPAHAWFPTYRSAPSRLYIYRCARPARVDAGRLETQASLQRESRTVPGRDGGDGRRSGRDETSGGGGHHTPRAADAGCRILSEPAGSPAGLANLRGPSRRRGSGGLPDRAIRSAVGPLIGKVPLATTAAEGRPRPPVAGARCE